ncbi:MAG: hypothetical protein OHK0046_41250 [Anaerolineae bacterium]
MIHLTCLHPSQIYWCMIRLGMVNCGVDACVNGGQGIQQITPTNPPVVVLVPVRHEVK